MVSRNITDWHTDPTAQFLAFRKELGLRPVEAARAMGVPYDTFKNWQSGRTKIPSVAFRTIELLLNFPDTARNLAKKYPEI